MSRFSGIHISINDILGERIKSPLAFWVCKLHSNFFDFYRLCANFFLKGQKIEGRIFRLFGGSEVSAGPTIWLGPAGHSPLRNASFVLRRFPLWRLGRQRIFSPLTFAWTLLLDSWLWSLGFIGQTLGSIPFGIAVASRRFEDCKNGTKKVKNTSYLKKKIHICKKKNYLLTTLDTK